MMIWESFFGEWRRKAKRFLAGVDMDLLVAVRIRYLPSSRKKQLFVGRRDSGFVVWRNGYKEFEEGAWVDLRGVSELEEWLQHIRGLQRESTLRVDGIIYDIAVKDARGFTSFSVSNPRSGSKTVAFVRSLEAAIRKAQDRGNTHTTDTSNGLPEG